MERKLFGVAVKWVLLGVAVVALIAYLTSHFLFTNAGKTRQAQTEAHSAEAMQEAGQAAVATVIKRSNEEMALKDLVNTSSKEIDNAPDPAAARAATLNAACQLRLYRDDPACAVRRADPEGVGGRSGRPPAP